MRSIVVSSSGWGGGRASSARLYGHLPLQERFSLASQWLYHAPFALLRCSIVTPWRAQYPDVASARVPGPGGVSAFGAWPFGGRGAGGLLDGQGLLHRLLDAGLQ